MDIKFNYLQKKIDETVSKKLETIDKALANSTNDVIIIKYSNCTRADINSSIELVSDLDISEFDNSKSYVYIFFDDNNVCLYVGKSKNIKARLTAHLVRNAIKNGKYSTSSKIEEVYDYLGEMCTKKNTMKLILISVEPKNMYGALEGQLIYKYNDMDPKQASWNIRED